MQDRGNNHQELLENLHILLVDDFAAVRTLLCNLLRGIGIRGPIDEAGDGLAAWKLIQDGDYDIVICDIRMPLMDGMELNKLLRATRRFADLPFLFISGEVTERVMAAGITSKYDGYIVKPFLIGKLKKEILKLINEPRALDRNPEIEKDSSAFLHLIQNDPGFLNKAHASVSEEDRRAFLRNEGFNFTQEELQTALTHWPEPHGEKAVHKAKELRKHPRYEVLLKVTSINGQPVADSILLDLSMWGAKIESLIPFRDQMEFSFSMPGEEGKGQKTMFGEVIWWDRLPLSGRYHVGIEFIKSMEKLHEEGELDLVKIQAAINKRNEEIAGKNFLTIKEFAKTIGVHWVTVWRWTAENRIKFKQVKAGCKILIPTSELIRFQESP